MKKKGQENRKGLRLEDLKAEREGGAETEINRRQKIKDKNKKYKKKKFFFKLFQTKVDVEKSKKFKVCGRL